MIALALLACGTPAPPPRDLGPLIPVLDVHTLAQTDDLVGWVRVPEDGQIRLSHGATGRTALFRDNALVYAATELPAAGCAAALSALEAQAAPAERRCEDRRWPIGAGFASYTALEPGAGCLIAWDVEDHALEAWPLAAMTDFRGAVYGAERSAIADLVPAPGDTSGTVWVRPTDQLDWGGVPLDSITYHFDADRLWQVEFRPTGGDRASFEASWIAAFGPGRDGWWQGCAVSASWEYTSPARFTIRSRELTWERSKRAPGAVVP